MKNLVKKIERIVPKVTTLQMQVTRHNVNEVFTYSTTYENQLFHSASVGKVFCTTLIFMAIEEQKLKLDSPITKYLSHETLHNLFVYKGVDYKENVTIRHLISHTSGINDYFEGNTHTQTSFMKMVLDHPETRFTPESLLAFTRNNQHAVGKPGERFLYSDSGFILLAHLLEEVYNTTYSELLQLKLCEPLGLKDTLLTFYDERFDQSKLAPIVFKGKRMEKATSLSCDYAGGGLQTTTHDLAVFLNALFTGKLINQAHLKLMQEEKSNFHGVMRYGHGMVIIDLQRLIPWMRRYPKYYGGVGSLSVHAMYDPLHHESIIINLGDPSKMRLSFVLLCEAAKALKSLR